MKRLQAVNTELTPRLEAAVKVLNKFNWTTDQMWLRKVAAEMLDAADRATEPQPFVEPPGHTFPAEK